MPFQGNDDVMRELNQAAADLKMNQPELETELMKEIGAYVAQGYFYSKPVPEAEFEAKLAADFPDNI